MAVQIALLWVLSATAGLTAAGWAVGVACAVAVNAVLARFAARDRSARLTPATWVTMVRASLVVGVAALAADTGDRSVAVLVGLAVGALVLDGADGWVARRTGASELGARLDGEVDAFLMLVLCVPVAGWAGPWVLAIGLMRYAFYAAGRVLPWLDGGRLPFRYWRKVVTAAQGIVLTAAVADVLPRTPVRIALLAALVLLAESFGRDVLWLWRRRREIVWTAARRPRRPAPRRRLPGPIGAALTVLCLLLVWFALVAPDRLGGLTAAHLARVPLEGLALLALAALLPVGPRRAVAAVVGLGAGALLVVRLFDMGFHTMFDRPFNPVDDWTYAGIGLETLRTSVGTWQANAAAIVAVTLVVAVVVLTPLAAVRVAGRAAERRRWTLGVAGALAAASVAVQLAGPDLASTRTASAAVREVRAVRTGLAGHAEFARELKADRMRDVPGDRLLTALRGKDVILVFVESYGRVAVQDSWFSPPIRTLLDRGTVQLRDAGFSARSGFLTSSTFGGFSWLAHGSVQAGVWADSKRRYDQLVTSDRSTLATLFKRAGWRTVAVAPANKRNWPEGTTFYDYDAIYDQRNMGYRGPRFAFGTMPDQYILLALRRLELDRPQRPPVFAEVDFVSSHEPWTRIPRMVPWDQVGDGSIFHLVPAVPTRGAGAFSDSRGAQRDFGHSIEYSLQALFSWIAGSGDEDLVVIMLGDHQPATIITGEGPTHDVPISVIARDPAVTARLAGWGWQAGVRPRPDAPVMRMDLFRDRFLDAFGPAAVPVVSPPAAPGSRGRPASPSPRGTGRSPGSGTPPSG
ncbi:MAG: CDP-alcohol phosphatidyltransferase family protein [Thermoleophilia bacterium]